MNSPDAELIARVLVEDDRPAFGQIVERHQSGVRRFLRHLTRGDHPLADDLAQDTFLQAYRGLAHFQGKSSFQSWLFGIAHNHWRNARRRTRTHASILDDTQLDFSVSSTTRQTDLQHDLAAALSQLSADEQLVIHLNFQQGLAHAEIAALLEWPLGTVKTHLARGKEKLRQLLAVWNPQI